MMLPSQMQQVRDLVLPLVEDLEKTARVVLGLGTGTAALSVNCAMVLIRFRHDGHPGTTTPVPPCAMLGGFST